jgi:hypothetical protein
MIALARCGGMIGPGPAPDNTRHELALEKNGPEPALVCNEPALVNKTALVYKGPAIALF